MTNELLEAALGYAERGWYVLPVRHDKTPYTEHGVYDATIDPDEIRKLWKRFPKANIAINVGMSGMMVYDMDPGSSVKALGEALGKEGLPKTELESRTPRGGQHFFYQIEKDEIVSPSVNKVSPHVDVRSFNSYVLLPPSTTKDGSYEWAKEGKPTYRTDEMKRKANVGKEKSEDRDKWIIDQDMAENVELAIIWIKTKAKPAIQGHGGDQMTYNTACMMKSYGLSEAMAFEVMWDHYNEMCIPEWDDDEMAIKVRNGYNHNTSQPGNMTPAYKTARHAELFKPIITETESGGKVWLNKPYRLVDSEGADDMKEPQWLLKDFIPENSYTMIYGAFSTFKSFLALDIALTICTGGLNLHNLWGATEGGHVLYALSEGRDQFVKRWRAWEMEKYGGARAKGLFLCDPVPKVSSALEPFVECALAASPDGYKLLVIDTVGRAMQGVNENAQENASAFTDMIEAIQGELGCAVIALHHTGKDERGPRGSSVFGADADVLISLKRENLSTYTVAAEMEKQKDAGAWEEPRHFKLKEVTLPSGLQSLVAYQHTPAPTDDKDNPKGVIANTQIADQIIYDLLDRDHARTWTQTALVDNILIDERMPPDLSDSVIKKYMKIIRRARTGYKSTRFYDVEGNQKAGQWCWKNTLSTV